MKLSAGEKLILLMLCEISERIDGERGFDTNFIKETIYSDQLWAFDWGFTGIPYERDELPADVRETIDILEMFSVVMHQFDQRYSPSDQQEVKAALGTKARLLKQFPGFDGDHDAHYRIARHLVERLQRFTHVRGATRNSRRSSSLPNYRGMLKIYLPLREELRQRTISKAELIELFSARSAPA
jgi:uncharacterized protein YfbU (UPF0304 family)